MSNDIREMIDKINGLKQTVNENYDNNIWYHGSNNQFNAFELYDNKTYKEFDLPVWFFTKDLNYAKTYGKFIYKVKLNIQNTFDTSNKNHFNLFIDYLKQENKTEEEIDTILDEQFFKELPYWTCEDAYYCAISNSFDSILIAEELERDIESVGVFDKRKIQIINQVVNENIQNDGYIYHGTGKGQALNIQRDGFMRPNNTGEEQPSISFTDKLNYAQYYAKAKGGSDKMIILRTKLNDTFKLSSKIKNNRGFEYVTFNSVPSSNLELMTNSSGWQPLNSWNVIFDEPL